MRTGLNRKSALAALAAVLLWASLAPLSALTEEIPPFLKTGLGLIIGSFCSLPLIWAQDRRAGIRPRHLLLGIYGLFGYHLFLFLAFATSPAVVANLVNYLWPLFIVLLAPLFIKSSRFQTRTLAGAIIGFSGAAVAISSSGTSEVALHPGYGFALLAAVIWATYSLISSRSKSFSAKALGISSFIAGSLAIACHLIFESPTSIENSSWLELVILGLGPLGAAFYFWDYALKNGNPQQVGLLSFLTPLLSTSLLLIVTGQQMSWSLALSAALIVGGALIGRPERKPELAV